VAPELAAEEPVTEEELGTGEVVGGAAGEGMVQAGHRRQLETRGDGQERNNAESVLTAAVK
jgi:hypothetical protein